MKKIIAVLLGAVLVLGLAAVPAHAVPAAAADVPGLSIGVIGYNALGADTMANRNAEFIDIANTSGAPVNVKGLRVTDSWAYGKPAADVGKCNNYTVESLPGITIPSGGPDEGKLLLPAGHVIRVYAGAGEPRVFGPGLRWHAVYMDHTCGYNGHFLNNNKPWDTVWITLGGKSEAKPYRFDFGYWVR